MQNEGILSLADSISVADAAVAAVLLACACACYRKGLVRSVFDLCGAFTALALSGWLYPEVSGLLRRNWGLFDYLKELVARRLMFSGATVEQTVKSQATFIGELPVPRFLSELLLQGNNDELYRIFNVEAVEDYVASYIAGMIINAATLVLVSAVVFALLRVLSRSLNIVNKIPVIGAVNRLGGALCGLAQGTVLIWFLLAAATLFLVKPPFVEWLDAAQRSVLAGWFYRNNLIMELIAKVI